MGRRLGRPPGRPLGEVEVKRMKDRDMGLLAFIRKYKIAHGGVSPSMLEMIDQTNISSTSMVSHSIKRLAKKGLISYVVGVARSIQVKDLIIMETGADYGKQD